MKKWILLLSAIALYCLKSYSQLPPLIAYNVAVKGADGKSNYEVFIMNSDGSNRRNISNSPDVAWIYTASKNTLYFISDRDSCYRCFFLYSMDANGKGLKKVSNLQLEDSYMGSRNSDGQWIVSGRIGTSIRYQLFLIDPKTGNFQQLTKDSAAMFRDPVFSPDGKKIAFVYRKNKRDRQTPEEVYIMNFDGTEMKQLSHYPENDISKNDPGGFKAGALRWHPTDNFISFISIQGGSHHIYAVTPTGDRQWQLTTTGKAEGWHDWSADGNWLVFDQSTDNETQYHIMLMNYRNSDLKQLTDNTQKYQQSPVFIY